MKFYNIAIVAFAIFTMPLAASAAISLSSEQNVDASQEETLEQKASRQLREWKNINTKNTKKFSDVFVDTEEDSEFNGLTHKKFKEWQSLCADLESDINKMIKHDKSNLKLDLNKWKSEKKNIHKALQNTHKESAIRAWEYSYNSITQTYNELLSADNNEVASEDVAKQQEPIETTANQNKTEDNYWFERMDSLENINKKLSVENDSLKSELRKNRPNLNYAFDVCVFMPLAIRYDSTYVNAGFKAAEDMVQTGAITDVDLIHDWNNYKILLENYGSYNAEIIKFIETKNNEFSHLFESEVNDAPENALGEHLKKRNAPNDEEFTKNHVDLITSEFKMKTQYGKFYNNEDCSIIYLDNVLNEYFDFLDAIADGYKPKPNSFTNFIKKYLDPDYQPKE